MENIAVFQIRSRVLAHGLGRLAQEALQIAPRAILDDQQRDAAVDAAAHHGHDVLVLPDALHQGYLKREVARLLRGGVVCG